MFWTLQIHDKGNNSIQAICLFCILSKCYYIILRHIPYGPKSAWFSRIRLQYVAVHLGKASISQFEAARPSHFFPLLFPTGGRFSSKPPAAVPPKVRPALVLSDDEPNMLLVVCVVLAPNPIRKNSRYRV